MARAAFHPRTSGISRQLFILAAFVLAGLA